MANEKSSSHTRALVDPEINISLLTAEQRRRVAEIAERAKKLGPNRHVRIARFYAQLAVAVPQGQWPGLTIEKVLDSFEESVHRHLDQDERDRRERWDMPIFWYKFSASWAAIKIALITARLLLGPEDLSFLRWEHIGVLILAMVMTPAVLATIATLWALWEMWRHEPYCAV